MISEKKLPEITILLVQIWLKKNIPEFNGDKKRYKLYQIVLELAIDNSLL